MSENGSVLPQAEIDALFKQATGMSISSPAKPKKKAAPAEAKPAAPAAEAAPEVTQATPARSMPAPAPQSDPDPPSAGGYGGQQAAYTSPPPSAAPRRETYQAPQDDGMLLEIQLTLDDLSRRLAKLESSINQVNRKMRERRDSGVETERLQETVSELGRSLRKVNSRVDGIQKGLGNTPVYAARAEFCCSSCGAEGMIAVPVKCTQCGEEGWWGWWPGE